MIILPHISSVYVSVSAYKYDYHIAVAFYERQKGGIAAVPLLLSEVLLCVHVYILVISTS